MKYEVRLQPLAEDDLEQAYLWAAERAPGRARGWLDRFQVALKSLELNPQRAKMLLTYCNGRNHSSVSVLNR